MAISLYHMKSIRLLLIFLSLLGVQLYGQERRCETSVGFRVGNATLDMTYANNGEHLHELISFLEEVKADSNSELIEVRFCGSASPEGSIARNQTLSEQRLEALEQYVRSRIAIPDSVVDRCAGFIAWDLLADLVEQSEMPYKAEAVDVIKNVPEFTYDDRGALVDSRKKHLMDLRGGRSWHYMARHFFSQIRNASAVIVTVWEKEQPEPVEPEETVTAPEPVTETVTEEVTETVVTVDEGTPFYMDIRTNMLYDAALVPNIGVDFYVGRNMSVGGNWMYGWWSKESKHRYWRVYGGDVNVRWWFGRQAHEKPLTGHHIGVYGQVVTYDFEFGGKGYMGGKPGGNLWERCNWGAGVEYGFSLPVSRHLNIDFSLGVGYLGGKYYKYTPVDGHYVWGATRNRRWFGPTKAEISLVWLLGRGNVNEKK